MCRPVSYQSPSSSFHAATYMREGFFVTAGTIQHFNYIENLNLVHGPSTSTTNRMLTCIQQIYLGIEFNWYNMSYSNMGAKYKAQTFPPRTSLASSNMGLCPASAKYFAVHKPAKPTSMKSALC